MIIGWDLPCPRLRDSPRKWPGIHIQSKVRHAEARPPGGCESRAPGKFSCIFRKNSEYHRIRKPISLLHQFLHSAIFIKEIPFSIPATSIIYLFHYFKFIILLFCPRKDWICVFCSLQWPFLYLRWHSNTRRDVDRCCTGRCLCWRCSRRTDADLYPGYPFA